MLSRMVRNRNLGVVAVVAIALFGATAASGSPSSAPLFSDHTVLDVTIDAPFVALMDVRPDKAYLNGRFTYTEADGTEKTLALKLRTRGNFRRNPENCSFAPLLLNFRKDEVEGTLFAGQNKLKLVTHCKNNAPGYEQNLLREYLVYRVLQELTDISYSTRLLRITYLGMEDDEPMTRYGFVIEDEDDVAERNGLQKVKARFLRESYNDPEQQNLLNVFEYMIGNTEYSFVNPEPKKNCCHNSDVLSASGAPPYMPLPFDFDFSGLVNAPYAEPNPRYPINTVRQRFYRGLCDANDILPATLEIFQSKQDAIYGIVDGLDAATNRTRREVRKYLESFYDEISDPRKVQARLIDNCYVPPVREE